MDALARTLRREEASVTLNRRAFDVLLYLVQNPGKVVARDELLKNVWPDTFVDENSLAQSISAPLPRSCLLLFLFPAIAGVCFSRRGRTISRRRALALALMATICMAVLALRGNLWVFNWTLIGPAWYLAVLPIRSDRIAIPRNEDTVS